MRAVRPDGTITAASQSDASFFPSCPVIPMIRQPTFLAAMTAEITFGEFPLVLIAIKQSPSLAKASTCLANTRSKL